MKNRKITLYLALALCAMLAFAFGCSKKTPSFAPAPSLLIGIGGFHQPLAARDMLAGFMPDDAEKVDTKIFPQLDDDFESVLRGATERSYAGSDVSYKCMKQERGKGHSSAFNYWMAVGGCMNVDLIIVPQVLAWRERAGGEMGVESPAAVTLDFFLLDVKNQSLIARSRFDETQRALSSNLLEAGKFFRRGGRWITAHELAREGMVKAIRDFGL